MSSLFSSVATSLRAPPAIIRRATPFRLVSTSPRLAMPARTSWSPNRYPAARRSDHVDVYKSEKNGQVRVHDPYQWLEHNTDETEQWTTAQERFTREYLDKNPERQDLEDEIRKNMDYAKVRYYLYVWAHALTSWAVLCAIAEGRRPLVLVLQQRIAGAVW